MQNGKAAGFSEANFIPQELSLRPSNEEAKPTRSLPCIQKLGKGMALKPTLELASTVANQLEERRSRVAVAPLRRESGH